MLTSPPSLTHETQKCNMPGFNVSSSQIIDLNVKLKVDGLYFVTTRIISYWYWRRPNSSFPFHFRSPFFNFVKSKLVCNLPSFCGQQFVVRKWIMTYSLSLYFMFCIYLYILICRNWKKSGNLFLFCFVFHQYNCAFTEIDVFSLFFNTRYLPHDVRFVESIFKF